jgi:hypothetical protein
VSDASGRGKPSRMGMGGRHSSRPRAIERRSSPGGAGSLRGWDLKHVCRVGAGADTRFGLDDGFLSSVPLQPT